MSGTWRSLREEDIVLACCRRNPPPASSGWQRAVDWQKITAIAEKEGVATLLYAWLEQHGLLSCLPDRLRTRLFNRYYLNGGAVVVRQTELQKILRLSGRLQLPVIVLKGAALAETTYDNPVLRPMADIDLLVRPEDSVRARNLLKIAGYRPQDSDNVQPDVPGYLASIRFGRGSGPYLPIHLHTHLINSTVPNRRLASVIPMAEIWRQATPASICGQQTLVLATHHQLLHLAEHGLRVSHSLTRWRYLCDIDRTVRRHGDTLDWEHFCAAVAAANLQRFVFYPLSQAVERLETPIPTEVLARLAPPAGWEDKAFALLLANNIRKPGLSYLLHLAQQGGTGGKLRFLYRTFLPPRAVLAVRYGLPADRIHQGHYLRRLVEVTTAVLGAAGSGLLGFGQSATGGEE